MKNNIFIPQKIKVGFQERADTYTKKLAYVVYYDQRGKLRKEISWEGWRDEKIEPQDFDNIPMSGFVLNKKVGGYETGWNHRQAYVRIYDPRDFEFEITPENLLYILENANCIKGKGLEGEFIYGWDGKDLVLIPTDSPDYKEMSAFNAIIHKKEYIKTKDLIVGATYASRNNTKYVYMGKFDCYNYRYRTLEAEKYKYYKSYYDIPYDEYKKSVTDRQNKLFYELVQINCGKEFFFFVAADDVIKFTHMPSISQKFISVADDNWSNNYAELFEKLEQYEYYSPVDDSKNIVTPYTFEEFCAVLPSKTGYSYWVYTYFYDKDGIQFGVSGSGNNIGKYIINVKNHKTVARIEITLEELFAEIQPVHLDTYLANGKFYERKY